MRVTPDQVLAAVAACYAVSVADLTGDRRSASIARARQIACYLLRELNGTPLREIGAVVNRHYTTIIHAVQSITLLATYDRAVAAELHTLRQELTRSATAAAGEHAVQSGAAGARRSVAARTWRQERRRRPRGTHRTRSTPCD